MNIKRFVLLILAHLSLVLAVIGAFLPVMPTTPFLLMAAYFYSKSSPRLHQWMVSNKWIGPSLRDWENGQVIRLWAKVLATTMIGSVVIIKFQFLEIPLWVKLFFSVILGGVLIFIWSRPSQPPVQQKFKDHFSKQSTDYAKYRPQYPSELGRYLIDLVKNPELVLDCGCGSGQLSVVLAEQGVQVIASDASQAQIQNAQSHPRVQYKVALAHETGLANSSVDLITVGQAAHWFSLDLFYQEVRRILKPGGVIALITYANLHVPEQPEIERCIQHFYFNVIGNYWPPERKFVEAGYSQLNFPFDEIKGPEILMSADWDLNALIGYLKTWSAVQAYKNKNNQDPLVDLQNQLTPIWGDPSKKYKITWPLSLRIGRV